MGRLTTHVLDTSTGSPAAGVRIDVYRLEGERAVLQRQYVSNADGRCERPLLEGAAFKRGVYQLVFHMGEYFRRSGGADIASIAFVDEVPVRFGVADEDVHYHVPLLVSQWSWSTYRGS